MQEYGDEPVIDDEPGDTHATEHPGQHLIRQGKAQGGADDDAEEGHHKEPHGELHPELPQGKAKGLIDPDIDLLPDKGLGAHHGYHHQGKNCRDHIDHSLDGHGDAGQHIVRRAICFFFISVVVYPNNLVRIPAPIIEVVPTINAPMQNVIPHQLLQTSYKKQEF